jgi:hypothetical protein
MAGAPWKPQCQDRVQQKTKATGPCLASLLANKLGDQKGTPRYQLPSALISPPSELAGSAGQLFEAMTKVAPRNSLGVCRLGGRGVSWGRPKNAKLVVIIPAEPSGGKAIG